MRWLSKEHGGNWGDRATEARELRRKSGAGIRCMIELEDGAIHEGTMIDVSVRGAGVHGTTDGVHLGDRLRLIATNDMGEKVRYHCEVKHINRERRQFGVEFLSRPEPLDPTYVPKTNEPPPPDQIRKGCPRCGKGMEFGHLVEHVHITSSLERIVHARWASGLAKRDPWRSEDVAQPLHYLRVDTYRCTGCGFLESYATAPYEGP